MHVIPGNARANNDFELVKDRMKQRAVTEMVNKTKTWEIAISEEEKQSKNYRFRRLANMALRQHMIVTSHDHCSVEDVKDNQMEYESPYQIKKVRGL